MTEGVYFIICIFCKERLGFMYCLSAEEAKHVECEGCASSPNKQKGDSE